MSLFGQKPCSECENHLRQIQTLHEHNKRLTEALRSLKERFDAIQTSETVGLSPNDIKNLFASIKSSSFDNDMKRYLRSVLMLIERTKDASLYNFLLRTLRG